jgi:hydrogenase nickel incorporation protein HypB
MCNECGCGINEEHEHEHEHEHDGHTHSHSHGHEHSHEDEKKTRILRVERNILEKNNFFAEENRRWLAEKDVVCVNLISSPGTGKTTLLEKTLEALKGKVKCAVIAGDQQTDNDARRLEGKGAEVKQIQTYTACHLNAEQISHVLPDVVDDDTDILFIENVGNLVCPAAFDLGENFKVALLSTTEGEDKAVKYPVIFSKAEIVILTKTDLIEHLNWDLNECRKNIRKIKPGVFIFELCATKGEGMDKWLDYLKNLAS